MNAHRPVVMGTRGMVSTGHPLASLSAVRVLQDGGNAFDAALCASGVLSVVKSYHCGLGGDLFGVFYSAKDKKVFALNGSGRSPRLTRREAFAEGIPHRGILAASTPGTVDAWLEAAERLGSVSIRELLEPAIAYADNGFPVFPHLANVVKSASRTLAEDPVWSKIFLPGGVPPRIGDVLVQKDLAATLRQIANSGREPFYRGEIANVILGTSKRHGGIFSPADFAEHRSKWEEPLHITYREHDVYVPPPNSYGLLLLLQLKCLSEHDLMSYQPGAAELVGLQVKAKETAWRAGESFICDPARLGESEVSDLLNQFSSHAAKYAGEESLNNNRAADTTYIATADCFGNWASLIQSVHQSFGCGIVVEGTGIVLNNRMSGFNLRSGHPNELAPGKLPAHTLAPALIFKGDTPVLAIGTPGGSGQTQFLAQILCNLFEFNMNIQEAIEAPRWQSEAAGGLEIESRFGEEVQSLLSERGYGVNVCGPWEFAFGGAEAVCKSPGGKVFMGAADPRREGYAIGY